jgi:hypothetical protein
VATLVVLIIQGLTHVGHLLTIRRTGASPLLVTLAIISLFGIAILTLYHTSRTEMPHIGLYILSAFGIAFVLEIVLRLFAKRVITRQIKTTKRDPR